MRPARDLGAPEPTEGKTGWWWAGTQSTLNAVAHHYKDSSMSCRRYWVLANGYPTGEGDDLCPECQAAVWGPR